MLWSARGQLPALIVQRSSLADILSPHLQSLSNTITFELQLSYSRSAMLRQTLFQSSRQLKQSTRLFSTSLRAMAEGDTGGTRSGGMSQQDSFSKREKASEDMYVRKQELEKLRALKEKVKGQKAHLDALSTHIDELMEESAGQGENTGGHKEK